MFEILLWFVLYIVVGGVSGLVMTRAEYARSIKTNEDPIPEKPSVIGNAYTAEEKRKLEIQRRKRLALKAKRSGAICFFLWPVCFAVMTLFGIVKVFTLTTENFAIKPTDEPFVSEIEMAKAQKIVDEYKKQQETEFNKQLES